MFTFGMFLCACSSGSNDDDKPSPPKPRPNDSITIEDGTVNFIGYLNPMSRATDTNFEKNDRIGVYAVKATDGDSRGVIANSGNAADNVPYSFDGSKFIPVANGIKKPEGYKYFYTAIYPYLSNAGATFDFSVQKDQRTHSNYTTSDLCTAYTSATDQANVDLKFNHRLSRIIVNITGDGWGGDNISVVLRNAYISAAVDVNALTFTAKGSKSDMYFGENGNRSFKLILPPQAYEKGSNFLSINVNGVTYEIKAESRQNLVSGKSYEYTLNNNGGGGSENITFVGDINPWNTEDKIDDVLPDDLQDKIEPYINIYKGTNPPNIEGTVYLDPMTCVYCEDQGHGGYNPGDIVNSLYIKFSNQNMTYNTIDVESKSKSGSQTETGKGAFISGTGNNFSAFFNTTGVSSGISTKTALVISGTKTSNGISNLRYAFVMVEKGPDPSGILMKEGVFRVFKDGDGFSEYTTWPTKAPRYYPSKGTMLHMYDFIR